MFNILIYHYRSIPTVLLFCIYPEHIKRSEFEAAHCRKGRNSQRRPAANRNKPKYRLSPTVLIALATHQPLKRSEFEAAHSRPLSRCRLLQRKYQRIADPMRKHRHNAPLYCPYIRLQESYLPSFHHLYLRQ